MNTRTLLITLGTTLTLAACNVEPTVVTADKPADPIGNQAKAVPPAELPPAIVATHTYRCKDNSLVHIDWLQDGKGTNIRLDKASAPTQLKPGADGKPPFTAEGYSLTGAEADTSVTVATPEKAAQSCRRG